MEIALLVMTGLLTVWARLIRRIFNGNVESSDEENDPVVLRSSSSLRRILLLFKSNKKRDQ